MKCKILHESKGRLRVHLMQTRMTLTQADVLEYYMKTVDGVTDVQVYDRTGDAVIHYLCGRAAIINALSAFSYESSAVFALEHTGRELNRAYEDKIVFTVLGRAVSRLFILMPVRIAAVAFKSGGYLWKGIRALLRGKLEVAVLDATAIAVSMLRGDYETASSIMFLLKLGGILEEWTHKKSVDDLARSMALNVEKVWLQADGTEVMVPVTQIRVGDSVVIRTGNMIPLDGKVISGEAMINQASMTGESMPVRKTVGSYVYAGTAIEEGECVVCVDKVSGSGRYDRIVKMIEESEKLKSMTEDKASHLADRLVPYSLGGTVLAYLLTRNVTKALSVLMVDFSCALKLSMPITVLSAMRESGFYHISVKGGRFLEAVSEADTIVFDKTGTLTHAAPQVARLVTFGGRDENEMLRLAACLEEHYPHSMANAVVQEATKRGLHHEERHSKVEYVVAHGISSLVENEKVIIGSYHFVFQDEGCRIPDEGRIRFDSLPDEYSHLYMAIGGELAAVICIDDPLREEASAVITSLRRLGLQKIVMMTGDNDRTAKVVAKAVGVDEYHAEVLPEDKAEFIRAEHEAGRKVIMIGDGVNDSPALSEADAGIAIADGAAIAREIADITISADDLFALVTLKALGDALMARIRGNYRFIIAFNGVLIALGVAGVLPPATSALLHNASTLGVSLHGMTNLLA
ncbi:heavy metal translocating P-type ATPase [Oscillibacter ruminantium]|uniref:heavy metal translocating P-type ATPase n=1 Tax=Oscillibacter ruminantium TaxID=1263547 RepID=UPI003320D282